MWPSQRLASINLDSQQRKSRARSRDRRGIRPIVTLLEERTLLSTLNLTVTTLQDDAGSTFPGLVTLRDAINGWRENLGKAGRAGLMGLSLMGGSQAYGQQPDNQAQTQQAQRPTIEISSIKRWTKNVGPVMWYNISGIITNNSDEALYDFTITVGETTRRVARILTPDNSAVFTIYSKSKEQGEPVIKAMYNGTRVTVGIRNPGTNQQVDQQSAVVQPQAQGPAPETEVSEPEPVAHNTAELNYQQAIARYKANYARTHANYHGGPIPGSINWQKTHPGMQKMGGVTYMIDDDKYYMEWSGHPVVIYIPPEMKDKYVRPTGTGPNNVIVNGIFKFVGNARGTNAYGGTVNIEKYECADTNDQEVPQGSSGSDRFAVLGVRAI